MIGIVRTIDFGSGLLEGIVRIIDFGSGLSVGNVRTIAFLRAPLCGNCQLDMQGTIEYYVML